MIYNSVSGAVVAVLAAGQSGVAKGQAWQKLYSSAEEDGGCLASLGGRIGDIDRAHVDYWVAARLHHLLKKEHWNALVAKYSTSKVLKIKAIGYLRPRIDSAAPQLFVYKAVTAWAIPKVKGTRRKVPASISVQLSLNSPAWRRDAEVNAAIAAGLAAQRRIADSDSATAILPDSFYDMNTWDLDATPESTRRRWRADIYQKLDCLIDDALLYVEELLRNEGVLADNAA